MSAAPDLSHATPSFRQTGGEALVGSLIDHGISSLYCLPGIQNDALFNALYDRRGAIEVVHTRHEQGAAYMALGAALATGKPSAYAVVPGPGFLNTTAALATAYGTGAKVLCLSGQIPSHAHGRGLGYLHELPDQLGIIERLTKWAARIERTEDIPAGVAEAFRAMAVGRPRPAGLEIPLDVLVRQTTMAGALPLVLPEPPSLDEEAIGRAASLLSRAERPLIFVGAGAQDASSAVRALAETLGAPVVAHRMGKGVLDDRHPLSQNLTAGHQLWRDCDVVLAIGTRLHLPLTAWGTDAALQVIKIDVDLAEMTKGTPPDLAIVGEAGRVLARLLDHLPRSVADRDARLQRSRRIKDEVAKQIAGLEPQIACLRAIRDVLPDDGVLVDESTQVGYVSRIAYETRLPRTFLSSGYQGTLGWGFAAALGVKHAIPDKPVVSITGDGGFMFNVQELATAVHHAIPLVTVLFNDGAFGNVRRMQQDLYGNRVIASEVTNPDFVRMGRSFGVRSERVADPPALRVALEAALASEQPSLIEVPCGAMPEPWPFLQLPRVRGAV